MQMMSGWLDTIPTIVSFNIINAVWDPQTSNTVVMKSCFALSKSIYSRFYNFYNCTKRIINKTYEKSER